MSRQLDVRSDVLQAIINYAYEQAATSEIAVLDFGDNEADLNSDEQLEAIQDLKTHFDRLIADGHKELLIVKE